MDVSVAACPGNVIPVEPSHPAPSSFIRSGETSRAGPFPPRLSSPGTEASGPAGPGKSCSETGRSRTHCAPPGNESFAPSASVEAGSAPGVEHQPGPERLAFLEWEVRRLRREMDRLLRLMALLEHDLAVERIMTLKPGPFASVIARIRNALSWLRS